MKERMNEILSVQQELSLLRWNYWKETVVFSPQWFFLLGSFLVLLIIWIKVVDKRKLHEILLFGLITLIIASVLDTVGGELNFWDYPYMVLPWGPRVISIDIMIAIFFMLLYQYFISWKTFLFGSVILSFIFTFIFEPIAIYLNIYKPLMWKSIYSFPIYILLAVSIRWLVVKLNKK